MSTNRTVGMDYEKQAAQLLKSHGYRILETNFQCKTGEIDLIAIEDGYLVFVEVKYRAGAQMGEPQEAVDTKKQQKISRTAAYYCMRHGISSEQPCRFDVAAFTEGKWMVIQNAFDYIE